MDINGLEPDTAYTVEARFGYYGEEEVVLYKEEVRTKSMEDSYEQQAGGYQIRWQAESFYGGFRCLHRLQMQDKMIQPATRPKCILHEAGRGGLDQTNRAGR